MSEAAVEPAEPPKGRRKPPPPEPIPVPEPEISKAVLRLKKDVQAWKSR